MREDPLHPSTEKWQRLREQLTGSWAEDLWVFTSAKTRRRRGLRRFLRFHAVSLPLGVELKYALMTKFESRQWSADAHAVGHWVSNIMCIIQWLGDFTPPIQSLMEKDLTEWEALLRFHLLATGRYRQRREKKLQATQEYAESTLQSRVITLFRQLYSIVRGAYDDSQEKPETEKDIWDMRKMHLSVNLNRSDFLLNFTLIKQPWLRQLAKKYIKFNSEIHGATDCVHKLCALRKFSRFLSERHPAACISDINRALILEYMGYLRECHITDGNRIRLLSGLRLFLETSAHFLRVEGLPRERLLFADDFPKEERRLSREIPQVVLKQLRKHLGTLPTVTSRMVVILLECGMRIGELCTLPLDCLICDDRHDWYLRSYQGKSKREHIIPLVSLVVIGTIQAQQQEVRERWGERSPYLFPSPGSPDLPDKNLNFANRINAWAVEKDIRDAEERLYRFQSHQFRHTVGMRLINDDIPLAVISRLLGHRSLKPTTIYANQRAEKLREELERVHGKRRTVNDRGEVVEGAGHSNDQEAQLVSGQSRGQTLPAGNCGRPLAEGDCIHANSCLTCHLWLTSTEDLPRLKAFYRRALHLLQRAVEAGNEVVKCNQERIISYLAVRIARLEDAGLDRSLSVEELLDQLRSDLAGAESAREEAREAGRLVAVKAIELIIVDLKANITALEGTL